MVDDDPTTLIAERGTLARVASDRTARSAEERANERAYVRRDHRRVHITMSTRTQTDDLVVERMAIAESQSRASRPEDDLLP